MTSSKYLAKTPEYQRQLGLSKLNDQVVNQLFNSPSDEVSSVSPVYYHPCPLQDFLKEIYDTSITQSLRFLTVLD